MGFREQKVKDTFNINFQKDDFIHIGEIIIPNFIKHHSNLPKQALHYWNGEFIYQIYKIFYESNFLNTGYTCYENELNKITKDDVVFDCGANLGIFSAYAATKAKCVYAFEPGSLQRFYLEKIAKIYPNIIIIPSALGSFNGQKQFAIRDNLAASGFIDTGINLQHCILYTEDVKVTTLDDFCENSNFAPSFIKMDVEGAEEDILLGGTKIINQINHKIGICLHENSQKTIGNILNLLNNYSISIGSYADNTFRTIIGKR